jgi:hypothetical protein
VYQRRHAEKQYRIRIDSLVSRAAVRVDSTLLRTIQLEVE